MNRLAAFLLSALLISAPLQVLAMGKAPRAPTRSPAPGSSQERRVSPDADNRTAPKEPVGQHFSKFEARRIRHACVGRANERGLKGAERYAYLSRCYFGRVAHRGLRQACQKEAAAKGLDKAGQRDFVRDCVRERSRDKEPALDAPSRPKEPTTKPER